MAQIYNNILQLIGRTPLVEAENLEKELGLQARILVKLEYLNPTGSVKDRAAKSMIEDAENRGILKEGAVIIEPLPEIQASVWLRSLLSKDTA